MNDKERKENRKRYRERHRAQIRELAKKYNQRPEVKERRRLEYQRNKARYKEYIKKYRETERYQKWYREYVSRPDVIMRHREYQKTRNRKVGWGLPIAPKNCHECGQVYMPKRNFKAQIRCPECRKVRTQIYFEMKRLRKKFWTLSQTSPGEAQSIIRDMNMVEGTQFTEYALNGLAERVKNERV